MISFEEDVFFQCSAGDLILFHQPVFSDDLNGEFLVIIRKLSEVYLSKRTLADLHLDLEIHKRDVRVALLLTKNDTVLSHCSQDLE